MAYDETLAGRIRSALASRGDVEEVKMFGGLTFMVGGHMACGVVKDSLMVRVDAARHEELVARAHARPMEFTRRPMPGFIIIDAAGIASARTLAEWIELGTAFAATKTPKARRPSSKPSAATQSGAGRTAAKKLPVRKTQPAKKVGARKEPPKKRSAAKRSSGR